jgi:hypothetical protein
MWVDMRRGAAIVIVLMGCGTDDPGMTPPPGDDMPVDVWEPMPGASIHDASLAVDGDTVWWAIAREEPVVGSAASDWLTATTPGGDVLVAPTEVVPDNPSGYEPDILVTPSAIVTMFDGVDTYLRRYDRTGAPLGAPYTVAVDATYTNINELALIALPTGGAQILASLQSDTSEVAIVELDASGTVGATYTAGAPDTAEPGGSVAAGVAGAARADGSTLIAWDRNYNGCISSLPSETLTTTFDGSSAGALQQVPDLPSGESHPMIAASGDTAYLAWVNTLGHGNRISIARYPDVTTVLAELDPGPDWLGEVKIALSGPDRGALAWRTDLTQGFYVMPFEYQAGTLLLGTARLVPSVSTDWSPSLVGFAATSADRYVIGWIEYGVDILDDDSRLYATEVDLAGEAMRPAPALEPDLTVQPRRVRCP